MKKFVSIAVLKRFSSLMTCGALPFMDIGEAVSKETYSWMPWYCISVATCGSFVGGANNQSVLLLERLRLYNANMTPFVVVKASLFENGNMISVMPFLFANSTADLWSSTSTG